MRKIILITALLLPCLGLAKIVTKAVEYKEGNTVLEGYLAFDDAKKGKLPGVLIVHEWDGLGSYVKSRAEQIAKLGYVAFAADIYGKDTRPKSNEESGKFAAKFKGDRPLFRKRVIAGLEQLKSFPQVDGSKTAAMGYCFGGTGALELARAGADVRGAVSFHGGLSSPTPEDAKRIKGSVLVLHGADDPYVKPEEVAAFQKEMRDANVDWQFVAYSKAVHAFTNPATGNDNSKGAAYNSLAEARSWIAMKNFFAEIFR